jgi:uncharacterized protein YyaL (SSP411 family)
MLFTDLHKQKGLEVARSIADWICNVQSPWMEESPAPGVIPFSIDHLNNIMPAPSWNYAFAFMGLAGAYKAFGDERYKEVAIRLSKVLKSLQILDPFHQEHYGAIRETSPLCPWCYTRDATSGGWGLIEMYRLTQQQEYFERAKLFGQWLMRKGLDENGYPWSGVQFEPPFAESGLEHCKVEEYWNHSLANCQGGCLNFFYQIYKATDDKSWCRPMQSIADIFVDYIQQSNGFYLSIDRKTKKPLKDDYSLNVLHHCNDDLGSLGLLCMYRLSKNPKYLNSVKRFLEAAWAQQRSDGFFEDSVAAIPIVLNATYESKDLIKIDGLDDKKIEQALAAMFSVQKDEFHNTLMRGALQEHCSKTYVVTMRANCYALILLLKLFAGVEEYLCAD